MIIQEQELTQRNYGNYWYTNDYAYNCVIICVGVKTTLTETKSRQRPENIRTKTRPNLLAVETQSRQRPN